MKTNQQLYIILYLRWIAFFGQGFALLIAFIFYSAPIQYILILPLCLVILISNAILWFKRNSSIARKNWLPISIIAVDGILLTIILHGSGGIYNPFITAYLLHILIAAFSLSRMESLLITSMCFVCTWVLYLIQDYRYSYWINMDVHRTGMAVSVFVIGIIIWYFTNILKDDLREQDKTIQTSRIQLEEQARFASIATLATGVAHELSTPLSTIAIISKELSSTVEDLSVSELNDLALIRSEVDRCRKIIDKLSISNNSTTPVRVILTTQYIIDRVKEIFKDKINIKLIIHKSELLQCKVEETTFFHCLKNIIRNAFEAGGTERPVEFLIKKEDDLIAFSVTDYGMGFEDSVISKVAEPFFTTKEQGQGMGLGLYVAKNFAKQHGGKLTYYTLKDHTTVKLSIPEWFENDK